MINNLLLWEKYRPKTIDEILLPDRILNHFKEGLTKNSIFYGNFGTGKTTLARILIGRYSGESAFLEINSSLYTSIDVLRTEIENFCKTIPMFEKKDSIKYVFLDEFDRTSSNFQDAFKAFIEKYHENVRFILTTNHFNKISDGIKSRFTSINFDSESTEEELSQKNKIAKRVLFVSKKEDIAISKEEIIKIVGTKFPDIRSIFVELQNFSETGSYSKSKTLKGDLLEPVFNIIYEKDKNYEEIYNFLMNTFGADRIDTLFDILGRSFVEKSLVEKRNVDKLFKCNYIISDLRDKLQNQSDPIILGMTLIGRFRDVLLN
jgi:DNA polymerase III delta prime subunit